MERAFPPTFLRGESWRFLEGRHSISPCVVPLKATHLYHKKQTNGHLFENSHSALITSILKGSEMVLCFQRGLGLLVVYSLIRLILISNNKVGLKSFRI